MGRFGEQTPFSHQAKKKTDVHSEFSLCHLCLRQASTVRTKWPIVEATVESIVEMLVLNLGWYTD
jgi:hypothetical protein